MDKKVDIRISYEKVVLSTNINATREWRPLSAKKYYYVMGFSENYFAVATGL
jgi:hypothetical protein